MVLKISSDSANITRTDKEENKIRLWKQFSLALLASLPFFTHGVETIELSSSAHTGHFISSPGAVPWTTTALILAAIVSAPVYCYLIDKWGRRSGVYLINLMQGASCIPLFLPDTEASDIILHVLAGVSTAGLFTVLPTYIREISDEKIRGITLTLMLILTTAGYLLYKLVDLEAMMFLMVALVAAQFLGMLVMVESPSYLVKVGKIELAKKSMAKLKCISENNSTVNDEIEALKSEIDRAKSHGNLTLWRILKNPIYRDITKIGLVLNTAVTLSGSILFLDQDKMLTQLNMNVESERTLVLSCMAAGSLVTVMIVKFIDRKYLLTTAYTIMVLSMGVLAVFTQSNLTVVSLRWLPVVSLGILTFAYGVVWGLPAVVMAEMLNIEIRSKILTMLFIYSQIIKLVHIHTFHYVEQHMGIYTVLYVFASINMFGGVYTIFIMPVVKDKSVKQIERQMKRVPLITFSTVKV